MGNINENAGRCLYLMRSGAILKNSGVLYDYNKPLSRKGINQVLLQLERFRESENVRPDCILCSTALRARQTVELLEDLFSGIFVFYRDALYLAPAFRMMETLSELDIIFRRVMIVGHNPGLEHVMAYLADPGVKQPLNPADCAVIQMPPDDDWHHLRPGLGQISHFFASER